MSSQISPHNNTRSGLKHNGLNQFVLLLAVCAGVKVRNQCNAELAGYFI